MNAMADNRIKIPIKFADTFYKIYRYFNSNKECVDGGTYIHCREVKNTLSILESLFCNTRASFPDEIEISYDYAFILYRAITTCMDETIIDDVLELHRFLEIELGLHT